MGVDSLLPVIDLLPVVFDQRLPGRYILSPIDKIYARDAYYDQKITNNDYCDREESLRYKKDLMTNSVKIVTAASLNLKGRYIDILA